jgi:hypothetical protein
LIVTIVWDPRSEYERRLAQRRETVARSAALDNGLAAARGLVFLGGLALLVLAYQLPGLSAAWLLVPIGVFVVLILVHSRVADRLARNRRSVEFYALALKRLDDDWMDSAVRGDRYADPEHPYSGDLDLFGRGSLFQLISTSRTRLGEDALASWLLQPADESTIRARQAAVAELRAKLDLREQIALLEAEVREEVDQNRLLAWSQEPPQPIGRPVRVVAVALAAATVAGLIALFGLDWGVSLFLVALMAELIFLSRHARQIKRLAKTADEAASGLAILSQVLAVLEREQFSSELLKQIRARVETEARPPSQHVARLHSLVHSLNNCLKNQFFAPVALLLCLPIHFVHAIEKWRARVGTSIPGWLQAVGEFEALLSLAAYAYEHPADVFPEIVPEGPLVVGEQLGHPLIPDAKCVRNDLSLGQDRCLLMISGSNMSGKSTLLRTLGLNVVLALAGAPVRAKTLRTSVLQVGTAMRVNDSLQDGRSFFYASLARLKSIVELADREPPLLCLLDEILQGTNSHDRRVGAEGVIRKLVSSGAISLVTTHDLALTEIVDSFGSRAANIHFEDRIVDGRMTFDYRIRPGVVRRSNALELMRMMGLDVGDDSAERTTRPRREPATPARPEA